ncbi:hypothetical protein GALL_410600 [mine drainage metagenome]|uniref:Uncharacterized protein n=1 Tax=mine drainage metagenome TaxID=410659 RepID=A0A1J5QBF3_9ZZZZ
MEQRSWIGHRAIVAATSGLGSWSSGGSAVGRGGAKGDGKGADGADGADADSADSADIAVAAAVGRACGAAETSRGPTSWRNSCTALSEAGMSGTRAATTGTPERTVVWSTGASVSHADSSWASQTTA